MGQNGGRRPGAGRPKGKKTARVLEREAVLRAFRDRVAAQADGLFNAQIRLAEGCQLLFKKSKAASGKHVLVTDPEEIKAFLDGDEATRAEYYYIATEKPNNEAIRDMLDRTFGKPTQGLEVSGPDRKPMVTQVTHIHETVVISTADPRSSGTSDHVTR
jgi:hypothetical protein